MSEIIGRKDEVPPIDPFVLGYKKLLEQTKGNPVKDVFNRIIDISYKSAREKISSIAILYFSEFGQDDLTLRTSALSSGMLVGLDAAIASLSGPARIVFVDHICFLYEPDSYCGPYFNLDRLRDEIDKDYYSIGELIDLTPQRDSMLDEIYECGVAWSATLVREFREEVVASGGLFRHLRFMSEQKKVALIEAEFFSGLEDLSYDDVREHVER